MDLNYKIGIVGSSGAGKTTLIMACYMAFRDRMKGIDIKPKDTKTEGMLQRAEDGFKSCIAHKNTTWTPPKFKNTPDVETYEFLITFTACNQTHNINLTIMDYPGQMLGNAEFSKEITPFLLECNAVFLPIPADVLMQWQINKNNSSEEARNRCTIAREMLNDESACRAVDNWMASKARNKQPAQLFFVPVRCEKYFTDNDAKPTDNSILSSLYSFGKRTLGMLMPASENELLKAVDEVYYQQLNYSSGMAECVSVVTTCVDTYGIVEECQMDVRDGLLPDGSKGLILEPQFKRREGMGRIIKIKNAFELLASTFLFQMEKDQQNRFEKIERLKSDIEKTKARYQELKKNRTMWESIWGDTPQMKTAQTQINNLSDSLSKTSAHLSIIKTFINQLNRYYEFNTQRTKIYNPETD